MLHLRSQVLDESIGDLYLEPLGKNTRTTLAKTTELMHKEMEVGGMGRVLFLMNAFPFEMLYLTVKPFFLGSNSICVS